MRTFSDRPKDLHLTAFYLHPEYLKLPVLRRTDVFTTTITIPATARNAAVPQDSEPDEPPRAFPRVFQRIADCLRDVLQTEVLHGHNELFTIARCNYKALVKVKSDFKSQLNRYSRSKRPFNTPTNNDESVLMWWQKILDSGEATILAVSEVLLTRSTLCLLRHNLKTLAVKLFSVLPNSMADERTASNYTWINRLLRSSQLLSTITDQIHIRQYYRSDSKVS